MARRMRRGDVCWYSFRAPDSRRPVLILTRTSAIGYLANVTVAPITTTIHDIPSEVILTPEEDGVGSHSAINLDNLQTIPKDRIGDLITRVTATRIREVERALLFALGVDSA